jgi:hypothetical protein
VRELLKVLLDLVDVLELLLQHAQFLLALLQFLVNVGHPGLALFLGPMQRVDLLALSLERDLALVDQFESELQPVGSGLRALPLPHLRACGVVVSC